MKSSRITKCLPIVITTILTVMYAGTMNVYAALVPTDSRLSIELIAGTIIKREIPRAYHLKRCTGKCSQLSTVPRNLHV